ncbi:MAG: aminotransferase class V-fold PLP-dependent enzyme [Methylococcaceae bacterium]|nr:aminotransferase class V-fold PLP-dependent enzyme [Methylococcaceae bacterium]
MNSGQRSVSLNPLHLSADQMRALGYRVIDLIVDHFESLRDKPVTRFADRAFLEQRLREPIPEHGADPAGLLYRIETEVLNQIMHLDHPRFFAYVPGPGNFVSVMADALAAGFNVFSGSWLESSGAAMIELVTIDWLRQLCGLPETAAGLFLSGGSIANLSALAIAREIKLKGHNAQATLYFSDQTHSSVTRAAKILGFLPSQIRVIQSDPDYRLSLADLETRVAEDRNAGCFPFCVVGNAGTTNTGAVDSFPEIAEFCRAEGLWLHADAAYGGGAVICDKGRARLQGIAGVDSLTLDPHKWLFQPYEMGCLLVREAAWLGETFKIISDYGKDEELGDQHINFCDLGIQLTRRFSALKLWLSLKTFGLGAFRTAVERGIDLAEFAEAVLSECSKCEVVSPARLGIVTFRYAGGGKRSLKVLNELNRAIVFRLIEEKFAMLSTTELGGMVVLRFCIINPATTQTDIRETVDLIVRLGDELSSEYPD